MSIISKIKNWFGLKVVTAAIACKQYPGLNLVIVNSLSETELTGNRDRVRILYFEPTYDGETYYANKSKIESALDEIYKQLENCENDDFHIIFEKTLVIRKRQFISAYIAEFL